MTASILAALVALIITASAGALLARSVRSAGRASRWAQSPGREAPRAMPFGILPHAITERGRQARALRRSYP